MGILQSIAEIFGNKEEVPFAETLEGKFLNLETNEEVEILPENGVVIGYEDIPQYSLEN